MADSAAFEALLLKLGSTFTVAVTDAAAFRAFTHEDVFSAAFFRIHAIPGQVSLFAATITKSIFRFIGTLFGLVTRGAAKVADDGGGAIGGVVTSLLATEAKRVTISRNLVEKIVDD